MDNLIIPDLEKEYRKDVDLAEVNLGLNSKKEEMIIYVAQVNNELHEKTQRLYARKLEQARRNTNKLRRLNAEIVAKSIIRKWVGIIDANGDPVPCTEENRIAILINKTYGSNVFLQVLEVSTDYTQFQKDEPGADDLPPDTGEDGEELTEEKASEKNL